jgi:transposase
MANKRKTMLIVRQIIQMLHSGVSKRSISEQLGISRNTVKKYIFYVKRTRLSYEEILSLDDNIISELLTDEPKKKKVKLGELVGMFTGFEKELRRVGVNRWVLWEEYKQKHPGGYSYTQFCYHYQQWSRNSEVTMHFEHKAGDKLFVDYTGKKLQIVNRETGEIIPVEVFVATLGASQVTYVEATFTQQKEDFIGSMGRTFWYIGGVTKAIIPDNLKSAVTESSKYEPLINENFAGFGLHYNTHILATRSRKPRDKALVEKAISIVYSRIFAPLRDRVFYSLKELNEAIRELLKDYNKINFKGRDYSRLHLFHSVEKEALKPLPSEPYEIKNYALIKVQKNSHIYLSEDKHYYSVPYRFIGRRIKVAYTASKVDIYYKYQRIAFHKRDKRSYKYTTIKEHLPSAHQFVADWNPDKFIGWAGAYGKDVRSYIIEVLNNNQHPEQNYKSCIGILGLEKKYGKERLNNACKRGSYYSNYSYRVIRNILEKGLDKLQQQSVQQKIPLHQNIRGKDYYQ